MARRRAPRRHDNGNRRTLHRPVLHLPGSRKTARIQELGSHLRLAAPPVGTAFRDDDRSAAAPRRRHEHKGLLQEAHPAHTMANAYMVGALQHIPMVHRRHRSAERDNRRLFLLRAGQRVAGSRRLSSQCGDDSAAVQLHREPHVVHVSAHRHVSLHTLLLGMDREIRQKRGTPVPHHMGSVALPPLRRGIHQQVSVR